MTFARGFLSDGSGYKVVDGQGKTVGKYATKDAAIKRQKSLQKRTGRRYYVRSA